MRYFCLILLLMVAGCTAEQARGISRLQELEKDFERGQPNYYSEEEMARMKADYPQILDERRPANPEGQAASAAVCHESPDATTGN